VAALFDEGEHFIGKTFPLSSNICLDGRRFEWRETFLKEGLLFKKMTTRLG
jgi:hypothetical protein